MWLELHCLVVGTRANLVIGTPEIFSVPSENQMHLYM
jgi:hypothetical protein